MPDGRRGITTKTPIPEAALSTIEEQAWTGFARAHFAIDRELDAMLHSVAGISLGDFFVLHLLSCERERKRRLTEIADQTLFTLSGISRMVNALIEIGLVERFPDPSDGRANLIAITDSGMERLEALRPELVSLIRRRFLDHFTPDELATMAGFWERVNGSLDPFRNTCND